MTLQEIKDRVYNDFVVSFENAITPLKKSFFEILANSISGVIHLIYIYLDNVKKESFLNSCSDARVLNFFAPLLRLSLKNATKSKGIVLFTGVNSSVIPSGTKIIYNSNVEYETIEDVTILNGDANVECVSIKEGSLNNTINNISLSLVIPIIGVDNDALCTLGFAGAIDIETIGSLRTRCITKQGDSPQIDNNNYYKTLALEVPNVRASFVSELKNGVGTFGVTVLTNSNNGVPLQSDLDDVEAYFILKKGVPAYTQVEYFLPVIVYQNIDVFLAVNSVQNQELIRQLIKDYIYRFQEAGTIYSFVGLSKIMQENGARLVNPLPTDNITLSLDEVLDVGTTSWS
mgnify:CR=1 FL=1